MLGWVLMAEGAPDDREEKNRSVKASWKDYVALAIAALQTIFLPLLALIAIILVLVFLIK